MSVFPVHDGELVEFATALARTPSESGTEGAAVQLTVAAMRQAGLRASVDAAGNAIGLIGRGEPGAPRLLIDGHIDSIPLHSRERWSVDPFGGTIRDGRLYGLGICDQKASIAAAITGVASVAERLRDSPGLVAVVASVCEEHMEGAALATAVRQVEPTMVITTEPSDTRLMIGHRGRAKIYAEVTGRAVHAGHSSEGINAAEALAALVEVVRASPRPTPHEQLGRRDLTCIDIASWPYPSVSTVPGKALARFDARFLPGETVDSLCDLVRSAAEVAWRDWPQRPALEVGAVSADFTTYTGLGFSVPEYAAAWSTPTDGPVVTGATRALASVGLDPSPRYYGFCTNGSYTAGELSIPTIGFGVGEQHMAHQVDEYVTLASLRAGAQGLAALAVELTDA